MNVHQQDDRILRDSIRQKLSLGMKLSLPLFLSFSVSSELGDVLTCCYFIYIHPSCAIMREIFFILFILPVITSYCHLMFILIITENRDILMGTVSDHVPYAMASFLFTCQLLSCLWQRFFFLKTVQKQSSPQESLESVAHI